MEKQRNSKILALLSLVIAVVATTVAFAALSTTLNIGNENTTISVNGKWQVIFESVSTSVIGAATVGISPTINNLDKTKINNYTASFKDPGDTITVNFIVKNSGTINAKLVQITKANSLTCTSLAEIPITADATKVCNELTYTLTDSEGIPITEEDTLNAGESKAMKLVLTYVTDPDIFDSNNLPTSSVSITGLGVSLKYSQAS